MKKSILSFAVFAITSTTLFAQIPNNGFENWTTVGTYSTPDNWETMNPTTAASGTFTAEKGTPGSPGASYLKLTSKTVSTTVVNGVAVCGKLNAVTMLPTAGFPSTLQPVSFTGKWQHMIFGSSQGAVMVTLTKYNTVTHMRDVVATANQTLTGMAMSWSAFTIPFNYVSSMVPDSCIIFLKASGSTPYQDDYLWVDNLAFSGSVTGLNNLEKNNSNISVYPNPATENVTIELNINTASALAIKLVDLTGKLIKEINAGEIQGVYKTTILTDDLNKGVYFLKVTSKESSEVKKIFIQ